MISTYSTSGVNILKGDQFVEIIKPLVKSTFTKNVLSGIGNFGAFYSVPKGYKNPVFVSSTDGVGTKIKIAIESGFHNTIGQDIVNHSVNDIAVCGAKPLFFLDYLAFGKLNTDIAVSIIDGMVKACKENGCALIGGETAEMPGMYDEHDYDLAGTIVGVAEKRSILNRNNVKKGNILIGLRSNGLHTNGYSLVRKVLLPRFKIDDQIDELGCKLYEELLRIHRSYYKIIRRLLKRFNIRSIAHITGGGISGNTKRVIPEKLKLNINWNSWEWDPVFKLIMNTGAISDNEMKRVFNLGIGLVLIVSKKDADDISSYLKKMHYENYIIGEIS